MHIGIAGIGKMGAAIAQRLMEAGHKVTVWNRSADKTKPVADAGAAVAATPAELATKAEAVITILTDAAAIDAVYNGPSGLLSGDVKRQAVHRDEHGAARDAGGARREGARHGRGAGRMPGRRQHRPGAAGQAARPDGRRARRRGPRQTDPRPALPAARTCRAGRLRFGVEVHRQHAADDLLAGAGRSAGALPVARTSIRSG